MRVYRTSLQMSTLFSRDEPRTFAHAFFMPLPNHSSTELFFRFFSSPKIRVRSLKGTLAPSVMRHVPARMRFGNMYISFDLALEYGVRSRDPDFAALEYFVQIYKNPELFSLHLPFFGPNNSLPVMGTWFC